MSALTVFTDGGSRGNPGPSALGGVIYYDGKNIHEFSTHIGTATNNEAEYQAFLVSLVWVIENIPSDCQNIEWFLDSKLVVEQLNKRWKVKEPRMRQYVHQADMLLEQLEVPYSVKYVPRADNADADALVNQALDAHME